LTNLIITTNLVVAATNNFTAIVYSNPAAYRSANNTNFPGLALTNSSGTKLVSITRDSSGAFPRLYFGQAAEGVGAVFNRNPDATTSDFYFGETADSGNYYFRGTDNIITIEANLGIRTTGSAIYPFDVFTEGTGGQFGAYPTVARFGGGGQANVFIDASASAVNAASLVLASWNLNTQTGPYGYYIGTQNDGNLRISQMPSVDETGYTSAKDFSGGLTGSLTLDKTGNIGIGTVSPAYMFDVNGAGHFNLITNTTYYGNGVGLTNITGVSTNFATTSNPTNAYVAGTLYTNLTGKKALLVGSFVQTGASASLIINYTNGGIGYRLPIAVVASAAVNMPFSVPLSPNATFNCTAAVGYMTNTVLWSY
jgi:hypothetical protein